jgi:hypothetical protein
MAVREALKPQGCGHRALLAAYTGWSRRGGRLVNFCRSHIMRCPLMGVSLSSDTAGRYLRGRCRCTCFSQLLLSLPESCCTRPTALSGCAGAAVSAARPTPGWPLLRRRRRRGNGNAEPSLRRAPRSRPCCPASTRTARAASPEAAPRRLTWRGAALRARHEVLNALTPLRGRPDMMGARQDMMSR